MLIDEMSGPIPCKSQKYTACKNYEQRVSNRLEKSDYKNTPPSPRLAMLGKDRARNTTRQRDYWETDTHI